MQNEPQIIPASGEKAEQFVIKALPPIRSDVLPVKGGVPPIGVLQPLQAITQQPVVQLQSGETFTAPVLGGLPTTQNIPTFPLVHQQPVAQVPYTSKPQIVPAKNVVLAPIRNVVPKVQTSAKTPAKQPPPLIKVGKTPTAQKPTIKLQKPIPRVKGTLSLAPLHPQPNQINTLGTAELAKQAPPQQTTAPSVNLQTRPFDIEEFVAIPFISCHVCGKPTGHLNELYRDLVLSGVPPIQIFQQLDIRRVCCRHTIEEPFRIPAGLAFDISSDIGDMITSSDEIPHEFAELLVTDSATLTLMGNIGRISKIALTVTGQIELPALPIEATPQPLKPIGLAIATFPTLPIASFHTTTPPPTGSSLTKSTEQSQINIKPLQTVSKTVTLMLPSKTSIGRPMLKTSGLLKPAAKLAAIGGRKIKQTIEFIQRPMMDIEEQEEQEQELEEEAEDGAIMLGEPSPSKHRGISILAAAVNFPTTVFQPQMDKTLFEMQIYRAI